MSVEQSVAASELRHAFRHGPTSEAAALFLHGLDSGLDWETATQAVAEGTAEHFGAAAEGRRVERVPRRGLGPRGGLRGTVRTLGRVLLGIAGGGVLGATLGMLVFAAAAALLDVTEAIVAPLAALAPWADPIYTRAALHSVADIHIGGLALAGGGGLIGLVLEPGSSVLGRLFAAGVANCGVLVVALLLIRRGVFRRSPGWIAASVGAQLHVALNVLGSPPSMNDLETIGLSFAVNACLPWLAGRRLVVSDLVSSVPSSILVAALVALALIIAYMGAGAVVVGGLAVRRRLSSGHPSRWRSAGRSAGKRRAVLATLATTSALVASSALVAACQIAPAPTLPASPAVVQHVAGPGEQAGSGLSSAR
ncbi:MAG TPA: hypothetical protein VF937_17355, partial [Chloroflexota bacterium]